MWAGLRPGRTRVRLELEILPARGGDSNKDMQVIHCYGHGGAGVTIGMGCAIDVAKIVKGLCSENV